MSNQTRIGIDKAYPCRFRTPDTHIPWVKNARLYEPPIYPDFESTQQKLWEAGLEVPSVMALVEMAKMATSNAMEEQA
jgi:hypothetical protein